MNIAYCYEHILTAMNIYVTVISIDLYKIYLLKWT